MSTSSSRAAFVMADLGIYIFGPWIWTLGLRLAQGRQILARTGKRTLVIGETPWVHQILNNFVSKLFSLSYGVTSLEVQAANPQDDLVHAYAHRVVRGTLLFLGIPDGRCTEQQRSAEAALIMVATCWAAIDASTGRIEPSIMPSTMNRPKRSVSWAMWLTVRLRLASASALRAVARSSGPWSES
jgi:hypothetical protein